MAKTRVIHKLNGQIVNNPTNWRGDRIAVNFGSDLQPTIETQTNTWVNDSARIIFRASDSGLNGGLGMFIGIPHEIEVSKGQTLFKAFDGYVDLTDEYQKINSVTLQAKSKGFSGPLTLEQRADGVTFGYLESIGFITDADFITVEKVIEKENNFIEIAITSIVIYLMLKETAESIQRINDRTATFTGILTTPPGGQIGAAIYAGLALLVEIAYTAVMILYITDLALSLVESFISPIIKDKSMTWRKMLEKGLEFLGLNLQTNLSDLERLTFFPSNPFAEDGSITSIFKPRRNSSGIPQNSDFGYNFGEFLEIVKRYFKAKTWVQGETVFLYNEFDPFWERQSTYVLPDVLVENERRNTEEFVQSTVINFNTDTSDEWTTVNYKGTVFETIVTPRNRPNDRRLELHKGFEQISIPYALGSRKDELNTIERALFELLSLMDDILEVFGVSQNLKNLIGRRVGMLKVWTTSHTVAKVLYVENGKLPSNHRNLLSAKAIWNNSYRESSFIRRGQRKIYSGVVTKFDVDDFNSLIEFGYFSLSDGTRVRAIQGEWVIDSNQIELEYELEEKYDDNFKEEFYEPG